MKKIMDAAKVTSAGYLPKTAGKFFHMRSKAHYFSLIIEKSIADFISEARRGYLGILWWIVEPIIYMLVFYVIFVVVFDRGGEDRAAFLLTGLVVWKWFATSISKCSNCIESNIGLVRQVYIPKQVFPGMVILTSTIKFLIIFIMLIVFLVITDKSPVVAWISLPVLMAVQLSLLLGLGSVLAAIVPFIPDMKLIIDNGLMLLFFLSGIFFDISKVSEEIRVYLYLNPMVGIIDSYRVVLLEGIWPDWFLLGAILLMSLVTFALGWFLLRRFDHTYVKVI